MSTQRRAVGVAELSAALAALVLLFAAASASISRTREMSKRMVCSVNLKGIGAAATVYASGYAGSWPVPPFDLDLPDPDTGDSVEYFLDGGWWGNGVYHPGIVGKDRAFASNSIEPNGSTQVSVTRAFWLLVRTAAVRPRQFICPSSGDSADPTENLDLYYDFSDYANISYGYQVPFGPPDTRPRSDVDPPQIFAADQGPFYLEDRAYRDWRTGPHGGYVTLDDAPRFWRPHNSPNHGGYANGEGQQVLFSDGHVTFARTPCAGIDNNNIYTLIEYEWNDPIQRNLIHGELPAEQSPPPFPGQNALGNDFEDYAATDSLIYP